MTFRADEYEAAPRSPEQAVTDFVQRHALNSHVGVAGQLIERHFAATSPAMRIEQDPETGGIHLELCFKVTGDVPEILDGYDRLTDEWVKRVPDDARRHIRFSYSIAGEDTMTID